MDFEKKCYAPHQSLSATASPRGEAYNKGRVFKFMRYATVRYETGNARHFEASPRGEGYNKGSN